MEKLFWLIFTVYCLNMMCYVMTSTTFKQCSEIGSMRNEKLGITKATNKQYVKTSLKSLLKTLVPHTTTDRKFSIINNENQSYEDVDDYNNEYDYDRKINLTEDSQQLNVSGHKTLKNLDFKNQLFNAKYVNKELKAKYNKNSSTTTSASIQDYYEEYDEVDENNSSSETITVKLKHFPSCAVLKTYSRLPSNLQHILKKDSEDIEPTVSHIDVKSDLNSIQGSNNNESPNSIFNFHFNNSVKFTTTVRKSIDNVEENPYLENSVISQDVSFKDNDREHPPIWNWKWIWNWNSDLEVETHKNITDMSSSTFKFLDNTDQSSGTELCSTNSYISSEPLTLNITDASEITEPITASIITMPSLKPDQKYTRCTNYKEFDVKTNYRLFNSADIRSTQMVMAIPTNPGDQESLYYDPPLIRKNEHITIAKKGNERQKINFTTINTTSVLMYALEGMREELQGTPILLPTPQIDNLHTCGRNNSNIVRKRKANMKFKHACRKGEYYRKNIIH